MCNCKTCQKIRSIYAVIKKLDEPDKKTIEGLLMDLVYTEEDYSLYRTLYPDVSCAFLWLKSSLQESFIALIGDSPNLFANAAIHQYPAKSSPARRYESQPACLRRTRLWPR